MTSNGSALHVSKKNMDEWEIREAVIDRFDVYDIIEMLGLTTEDLVDQFDILMYENFRKIILERL